MDNIIVTQNQLPPSRRPLEMAPVWVLSATMVLSVVVSQMFVGKTYLIILGAIAALATYALARLGRGNIIFPSLPLLGVLIAPACAYLLSYLFAGNETSLWGRLLPTDALIFVGAITILGLVAALALRNSEHYKSFFKGLLIAGLLLIVGEVGIITLGQFIEAVPPTFALLGSFADTAFALGLFVLGAMIALRSLPLSVTVSRMLIGGLAVSLLLLALLDAVLVWIFLAVVSFGYCVEANMRRRSEASDIELEESTVVEEEPVQPEAPQTHHTIVLPLIVLVASLFFLLAGSLVSHFSRALSIDVLSVRPSWEATMHVLGRTYSESPVFGGGPSSFNSQWMRYRPDSINMTTFWNFEFPVGIGFIPTSFITTGLLGALAWITFIAVLLGYGGRLLLLRAPKDPFVRFASTLSFVGVAYLFVCAVFDVPGPVLLTLLFVFAGLLISTLRYAEGAGQWGVVFSKAPKLALVISTLLTLMLLGAIGTLYPLIERYTGDLLLTRSRDAFAAGELSKARDYAHQALALKERKDAYSMQMNIARARLNQLLATETANTEQIRQEFQATLTEGINAGLTVTKLSPNNPWYFMDLGALYSVVVPLKVQGAYENAKEAYLSAMRNYPSNPQIPFQLAQLEVAQGNNAAAEEYLGKAISLKQDYTPAIILLSQLQVSAGRLQDALAAAEAAVYFQPNDPGALFQVGLLRAVHGDSRGAIQALTTAVSVNPGFVNARYYLAALYAKQGDFESALSEINAIAAVSADNAKAVEPLRKDLAARKNPFPANLLSAPTTALSQ